MSFLFAYIASQTTPPGWPIGLMYGTEAVLVILAVLCVLVAVIARGKGTRFLREAVAAVGGVCAGVGLIMPFELAPFFFHARGEVMLATIGLNLVYPVVVIPFILGLRKLINRGTPNVGADNRAG